MRSCLLVLAACGSPALVAAPVVAPPTGPFAGMHHATIDEDLDKLDPVAIRRGIVELLREPARLACPAVEPSPDCTWDGPPAFGPPPIDTAGLDDPCFRRELVMRAMTLLTRDDIEQVGDANLAAAVSVDAELAGTITGWVAQIAREHVLPIALAAHDVPQSQLAIPSLLDDELAVAARHHLYTNPDRYDRAGKLAVLADRAANPGDRVMAIPLLLDDDPSVQRPSGRGTETPDHAGIPLLDDLHAALLAAADDPDCQIAGAAALALADHGDDSKLARRPLDRTTATSTRALCVIAGELIAGRIDHTLGPINAVLDSFQDPHAQLAIARARTGDLHATPWLVSRGQLRLDEEQDLLSLLASCRGARCAFYEWTGTLTFVPAPDGGLYLTRIDAVRHVGACGGP